MLDNIKCADQFAVLCSCDISCNVLFCWHVICKVMQKMAETSKGGESLQSGTALSIPSGPPSECESSEVMSTPRRVLYAESPLSGSAPPKKKSELVPVKEEPELSAMRIYQARKLELQALLAKQKPTQNLSARACCFLVLLIT